nr:reverse transcriptase domain-containing protein [Tanacetum cinerariifolium]
MADQRTMAKLLCVPTEGYAVALIVPSILNEHFKLKHSVINLVTLKQFFGFKKDDPHAHIRYFNKITSTMRYKDVPETSIKLLFFPFSIDGPARIWLDKESPRSILTWDDLDLLRACPHHGFTELHQLDTFYNGLNPSDQDSLNSTNGGNLLETSTQDALKIIENKSRVQNSRNKLIVSQFKAFNVDSSEMAKLIDAITQVTNVVATMMKQIQAPAPASVKAVEESCVTCGGADSYRQRPATDGNTFTGYHDNIQGYVSAAAVNNNYNQVNTASSSSSSSLPRNIVPNPQEDLKDITTRSVPTLAGPSVSPPPLPFKEPSPVSSSSAPISFPKILEHNSHQPSIPYPTRLNMENLQGKDDIQIHSFLQMFKKIHFNISFFEALSHMPKFAKMIKDLLTIKEKLLEIANTPVNENCSAVILKKLPKKLKDTRRFLIPSGIAEDVFVQVGKFTFPTDFVVVDYEVDPQVPLILGRPFIRKTHALVNVHGEKLTLLVGDEELVFNVESALKHPQKHSDNSTLSPDPVVESLSHSITPFGDSDFLLEETDAFLSLDDLIPPCIDDSTYDSEGDIFSRKINDDPTPDLPPIPYPVCLINDAEKIKSPIDDPLDLDLKDLPSHLEYAVLEGTSKLPVIIAKDLKREEKEQLLKVLKSHKRAIAWKISDIQVINPNFCTHKILMKDDFKPAVQHQRQVNPKIHEVIKAEVIKLLDAGLIYLIFDSPWVSLIHIVPKKRGMTVITNENNELIPTRLVTGWRGCIDYRKLNDATRKDHFPLPFMDQMLERLAGNEFYCFLDRFSGYFQIQFDPQDQENTTFTCPYGTFAYRRMPFGLSNAPGRFQRLFDDVWTGMKLWTFFKLSIMDPSGDTMARTTSRKKFLSLIFSGKLKSRWTGPFTVAQVFPYGTIELSQADGLNFKVNGHRLKHYFGGDIQHMIVSDIQTFPMDQ